MTVEFGAEEFMAERDNSVVGGISRRMRELQVELEIIQVLSSAKTLAGRNLHDSWCRFRPSSAVSQRTLFSILALCEAGLPCSHFDAVGS
jgi:hypothetical protein